MVVRVVTWGLFPQVDHSVSQNWASVNPYWAQQECLALLEKSLTRGQAIKEGRGTAFAVIPNTSVARYGQSPVTLLIGAVAQAMGIRPIFVAAGLITVGAAAMAAWAIEEPETGG